MTSRSPIQDRAAHGSSASEAKRPAQHAGPLRLGTRGSQLAMIQAREVAARLRAACPELEPEEAIEIVVVRTTGDRIRDRPLTDIGGKALFAKEIEAALIADEIDLAVHSLKDLPSILPEDFELAAVLPREDPRDCLIGAGHLGDLTGGLADLPKGSVVGTCSPRRAAQLLMRRPDLSIIPLRGNVDTRLAKLKEGEMVATLLGQAGLNRLKIAAGRPLDPEEFLPAATQGTIGLEIRRGDRATAERAAAINHHETWLRAQAERACLAALDGSCHTPVAAFAQVTGDALTLDALFLLPDGRQPLRARRQGSREQAETLGRKAGEAIMAAASPAHLALLEE